jgi:antitoxin VapB
MILERETIVYDSFVASLTWPAHIKWATLMSDTGIAKIFMHGRSQAVRLPLAFRLPGDRVRVRRVESGILLEPMVTDINAWFAELDRFADVPFMEEGRQQPPMPEAEDQFA